ncbi:MAG TPA: hypothetical protein VFF79_09175 [Conexibacter sp.]|nr:hypothetical protein [Conexibacter sp.]
MHETTVRFSDELWKRIQEASRQEGVSAAQFVREATLSRIATRDHAGNLQRDLAVTLARFDRRLRQFEERLERHGLR